jgi:hypothetical protein
VFENTLPLLIKELAERLHTLAGADRSYLDCLALVASKKVIFSPYALCLYALIVYPFLHMCVILFSLCSLVNEDSYDRVSNRRIMIILGK